MGFGSIRHAYTDADCNRYSDCNCDSDTYSAANSDRLANSNVHTNTSHAYANPNADTLRRSYDNTDKRKYCAGHHRHW